MRVLGEEMHRRYGRPVVVENRTGGGMNIGGRACAEAPNDGATICNLPSSTLTYNQWLYKKLPYDPERFAPITNPFFNTQLLVVEHRARRQNPRRTRGALQGQARHPELHRAVRCAVGVHGLVAGPYRRRHGQSAVQGWRRCRHRHAVGRDPGGVPRHRQLAAACRRRHRAPAGRGRRAPLPARPGRADDPRTWLRRRDDAGLFRHRRPARHAAAASLQDCTTRSPPSAASRNSAASGSRIWAWSRCSTPRRGSAGSSRRTARVPGKWSGPRGSRRSRFSVNSPTDVFNGEFI